MANTPAGWTRQDAGNFTKKTVNGLLSVFPMGKLWQAWHFNCGGTRVGKPQRLEAAVSAANAYRP